MTDEAKRDDRYHDSNSQGERSEFERDRDRVLYTEAFRRLSGVSQVAFTGETELYHDRLSHSLKVAQVGRRIAEYMGKKHDDVQEDPDDGESTDGLVLNPSVVETAALAHDIGHPPFGHPAEKELDQLLQSEGIGEGFEGNAQSLRVVTHTAVHHETERRRREEDEEVPESNIRGLNLTRASLNALIKYPWSRSAEEGDLNEWGEDESQKFGRYAEQREVFNWIREDSKNGRRAIEAEVMDWADDLVYAVHDVADFYKAGVIPLEQILVEGTREHSRFVNKYVEKKSSEGPHNFSNKAEVKDWIKKIRKRLEEDERPQIGQFRGTREDRRKVDDLTAWLIGRFVGEDEETDDGLEIKTDPDDDERYLDVPDDYRKEVGVLKFMLLEYVLESPTLQAQRRGQRTVIRELFETLYDAVDPNGDESIQIVHAPFREEAKNIRSDGNNKTKLARLVVDMITSMTEQQAINLHKRLTGDTPGSIQESIVR